MNVRKNFEAVFLAAAVLGLSVSYATAEVRPLEVAGAAAPVVIEGPMHVVVVKGERLTTGEKLALN